MDTPTIGRTRKAAIRKTHKAVLVYQNGLANVFAVDCFNVSYFGRNARRLLQNSFEACEWFARGLSAAGIKVASMRCDQAGDIINARWSEDLDNAVFADKQSPVFSDHFRDVPFKYITQTGDF